jgi:hypothetical protein
MSEAFTLQVFATSPPKDKVTGSAVADSSRTPVLTHLSPSTMPAGQEGIYSITTSVGRASRRIFIRLPPVPIVDMQTTWNTVLKTRLPQPLLRASAIRFIIQFK